MAASRRKDRRGRRRVPALVRIGRGVAPFRGVSAANQDVRGRCLGRGEQAGGGSRALSGAADGRGWLSGCY